MPKLTDFPDVSVSECDYCDKPSKHMYVEMLVDSKGVNTQGFILMCDDHEDKWKDKRDTPRPG